jgi:hypothetical protein
MAEAPWKTTKVFGRDEVLADIERRAFEQATRIVADTRNVMNDFEVDIYRIILGIAKVYGKEKAYEIMSDTVVEKRMMWLEQAWPTLNLQGTDLEKGFEFYVIKYLRSKEGDYSIVEKTDKKIIFKKREYVNALSNACKVLGIDLIEVQNMIYARATNFQFARINPNLRHVVLKYEEGWYTEMVEIL